MRTFKINGKDYKSKALDFNLVCDLEDMGIAIDDIGKKQTATMRAYFALCANVDKESAGLEMQEHVKAGGNFKELAQVFNEELEKSDFFRAVNENAEKEVAENQSKKK